MAVVSIYRIDRCSIICEFLESSKNLLAVWFSSDLVKTRENGVRVCCTSAAVSCPQYGVDCCASSWDFSAGAPVTSKKTLVAQMDA
jgi:hypothetical protein